MATTILMNIKEGRKFPHAHLAKAIPYIMNPEKTRNGCFVGAFNCMPETAYKQMLNTKKTMVRLVKGRVIILL